MPEYGLSGQDYSAFRKWALKRYAGTGILIPANNSNLFTSPYYLAWGKEGYPGYTPKQAGQERAPTWFPAAGGTQVKWDLPGGQIDWGQVPTDIVGGGGGQGGGGGADLGTVNVETIQGRQFIVRRNAQGQIIDMQELSARGYSDAEVASMIRGQAMAGMYGGRSEQQVKAEAYEQIRQEILATLNQPADWIKRWELKNKPNPYKSKVTYTAEALRERLKEAQARKADIIARTKDPFDPLTMENILDPQSLEEQMYAVILKAPAGIAQSLAEQEFRETTTVAGWSGGVGGRTPKYTPPKAPAWLPQFAPGQIAKKPITKEEIPTPSGQQLTRTPWSELEGLRGFVEWSGGRPWRDILGHAELMQPRTPREAGGGAWRAARQYV